MYSLTFNIIMCVTFTPIIETLYLVHPNSCSHYSCLFLALYITYEVNFLFSSAGYSITVAVAWAYGINVKQWICFIKRSLLMNTSALVYIL